MQGFQSKWLFLDRIFTITRAAIGCLVLQERQQQRVRGSKALAEAIGILEYRSEQTGRQAGAGQPGRPERPEPQIVIYRPVLSIGVSGLITPLRPAQQRRWGSGSRSQLSGSSQCMV